MGTGTAIRILKYRFGTQRAGFTTSEYEYNTGTGTIIKGVMEFIVTLCIY